MSAILSADDLNDFISPGVACIKPVESLPAAPRPPTPTPPPSDTTLEHEVILDGQGQGQGPSSSTSTSTSTSTSAPATQISLTDCLACSGCVTSAEAVLVSLQSHSELLHALDGAPQLRIREEETGGGGGGGGEVAGATVDGLENPDSKLFVASVSPQTRASLAAAVGRGIGEREAGNMVAQLLAGSGGLRAGGPWNNAFAWVVDTNAAREACLLLGAEEALGSDNGATKPILSSSCPGWVCYAEKTHPHVLPHMSRVKSPQALMGTLLKTMLSRRLKIAADRIWHLAVMPCFDKKLEASRAELTDAVWGDGCSNPTKGVRDVDCVITSKEILMLAESRGLDFFALSKAPVPASMRTPFPDPALQRFLFPPRRIRQVDPAAGTSGGNLHFTLQYVAAQHPGSKIETIRGRNVDVMEYIVKSASGEQIFRAARYYGFRNIQNLVRRLKPARPSRMPGAKAVGAARRPMGKPAGLEYAYVEVMACPGGCTNGGGQIKVDDPVIVARRGGLEAKPGPLEQKQWLAQVDEAYFSAEEEGGGGGSDLEMEESSGRDRNEVDSSGMVGGISPSYIHDTLAHWASITGIDIDRLTRTSFREVVSDVGKNKTSDTERVVQLAGKIGGGW